MRIHKRDTYVFASMHNDFTLEIVMAHDEFTLIY